LAISGRSGGQAPTRVHESGGLLGLCSGVAHDVIDRSERTHLKSDLACVKAKAGGCPGLVGTAAPR
jgi:hypothetical protein